jgi:hypothetical protein
MVSTKTIVCLANSVKMGGFCVAGKEMLKGGYGAWVRPVSARATTEIAYAESQYADGASPQLLDIVEIPIVKPVPHAHQTENQVIDGGRWKKTGTLEIAELAKLLDKPRPLWIDGRRTYSGINDCTTPEEAAAFDHSLVLIRPENLMIRVGQEGGMYQKRAVRAYFTHSGVQYALKVTDPVADAAFRRKEDGTYALKDAFLCVSLTEPYDKDKRCHKLAAGITSSEPF